MEQPGSPTPSEDEPLPMDSGDEPPLGEDQEQQEQPETPNEPSESASNNEGVGDHADTLNEMYLTLGHLVAAHDLSRADAEKRLKDLSKTSAQLQQQREEALAEGDHMKYANAIRGLSEVAKIAAILQNDAEDELRAPSQSDHSDGLADQRDGDGDVDDSGNGQPLAGDSPGVGGGGAGAPDDHVGLDGDLEADGGSGGSDHDPGTAE